MAPDANAFLKTQRQNFSLGISPQLKTQRETPAGRFSFWNAGNESMLRLQPSPKLVEIAQELNERIEAGETVQIDEFREQLIDLPVFEPEPGFDVPQPDVAQPPELPELPIIKDELAELKAAQFDIHLMTPCYVIDVKLRQPSITATGLGTFWPSQLDTTITLHRWPGLEYARQVYPTYDVYSTPYKETLYFVDNEYGGDLYQSFEGYDPVGAFGLVAGFTHTHGYPSYGGIVDIELNQNTGLYDNRPAIFERDRGNTNLQYLSQPPTQSTLLANTTFPSRDLFSVEVKRFLVNIDYATYMAHMTSEFVQTVASQRSTITDPISGLPTLWFHPEIHPQVFVTLNINQTNVPANSSNALYFDVVSDPARKLTVSISQTPINIGVPGVMGVDVDVLNAPPPVDYGAPTTTTLFDRRSSYFAALRELNTDYFLIGYRSQTGQFYPLRRPVAMRPRGFVTDYYRYWQYQIAPFQLTDFYARQSHGFLVPTGEPGDMLELFSRIMTDNFGQSAVAFR